MGTRPSRTKGLIRKTPLRPSTRPSKARSRPLKGGGPIKPKKRSKAEVERVYGPPGYREHLMSYGCLLRTAELVDTLRGTRCDGPMQLAHTQSGGKGRKADYSEQVPACMRHHQMYDQYREPFARDSKARERAKFFAKVLHKAWLDRHPRGEEQES